MSSTVQSRLIPTGTTGSESTSGKASLKWQIIGQFVGDFPQLLERRADAATRTEIELRLSEACAASAGQLTEAERNALKQQIKDEVLGFGPIQPLLDDSTVSEVMVNR